MQKLINMKRGTAAVLVIVLVVALLALGGVLAYQYSLFGNKSVVPSDRTTNIIEESVADRSEEISSVGSGDKLSDIEKELSGTDIDSLDKDVLGVKAEAAGL